MSSNNPIETLFLSHKNVLSGFTHMRQVISSYSSKFHRIGRCPQTSFLSRPDTFRTETPNPSNHRIDTDTGRSLRHYRHNSP